MGAGIPSMRLPDGVNRCCECGSFDGPHYVYEGQARCVKCDVDRLAGEIERTRRLWRIVILAFAVLAVAVAYLMGV